jgi:hypothetical protein
MTCKATATAHGRRVLIDIQNHLRNRGQVNLFDGKGAVKDEDEKATATLESRITTWTTRWFVVTGPSA